MDLDAALGGCRVPGATAKVIEVPEIQLGRMLVILEGATPLITHRLGERARQMIKEKQQGAPKTARPPRDPDAEGRRRRSQTGGLAAAPVLRMGRSPRS